MDDGGDMTKTDSFAPVGRIEAEEVAELHVDAFGIPELRLVRNVGVDARPEGIEHMAKATTSGCVLPIYGWWMPKVQIEDQDEFFTLPKWECGVSCFCWRASSRLRQASGGDRVSQRARSRARVPSISWGHEDVWIMSRRWVGPWKLPGNGSQP